MIKQRYIFCSATVLLLAFTFLFGCKSQQDYYLDDVRVEFKDQGKRSADTKKYVYDAQIEKTVMIKNNDWDRCPLSKKFLSKYNSKDSIFPQYDIIQGDLIFVDPDKVSVVEHKDIFKLTLKDKSTLICVFYGIWNDNNEVDDILTYIIPEDKMSLTYEEMYDLAFNEYGY